jgi:CheY-like chemotaxis protein
MPDSSSTQQLPSLLLIDDDAISREVLQMTLEMNGFAIEAAEDGPSAMAQLAKKTTLPDLILMDTQMPGLSGIDLIHALRGCTNARIVAISGSDPGDAIRQAADGFLMKPIQPEALLAWINGIDQAWIDQVEPGEIAQVQAEQRSGASLVDPVVLGKLRAMMPASAVREIYIAVASDLETRLIALQSAMNSQNGTEVARIAHAIKGGCAMVGLTEAREAAARLESSNLPVTWPAELSQLHIALSGLEGMLGDDFPA